MISMYDNTNQSLSQDHFIHQNGEIINPTGITNRPTTMTHRQPTFRHLNAAARHGSLHGASVRERSSGLVERFERWCHG